MKTKKIKINLTNYKSLFPGILPSYDEYGNEVIFNNELLSKYNSGNYGMIVKDIVVPLKCIEYNTINNYTNQIIFLYENDKICVNNTIYTLLGGTNTFIIDNKEYSIKQNSVGIPYTVLKQYYLYACQYHNLIKSSINQDKTYKTAIDYYNNEVFPKTNEIKEYYQNLDNTYYNYGGDIMYNWICNNVIKKIKIPEQFDKNWDCEFLYYPEILEWLSWFEIRFNKYKNNTVDYNDPNCCDYKEYIDRGGDDFFNWLKTQINEPLTFETKTPHILLTLLIEHNIDDLGIMSPNIKQWEKGEMTSGLTYDAKSDTFSSKYEDYLTIYNDEVWKSNGKPTYTYDNVYKEINFDEQGWDKVGYSSDINLNILDNIHINENSYEIYNNECILMDNIFLLLENIDTIKFNNKKYIVFKNDYNIPYILENGHIKHLNFDKKNKIYYIKNTINDTLNNIEIEKGVIYQGSFFIKKNNYIEIAKNNCLYRYEIFNNFIKIKDNYFLIKNNQVFHFEKYQLSQEKHTQFKAIYIAKYSLLLNDNEYNINGSFFNILKTSNERLTDEVNGYTDSKLDALKPIRKCFDDIGNELPGMFIKDENDTFIQPTENSTLDIYYHIGDTSGFELKKNNDGSVSVDKNNNPLYYGNIITNIEFYYKDVNGNIIDVTKTNSIDETNRLKNENNSYSYEDNMSCTITYLIGAVLTKKTNGNNTYYEYDNANSFGIEYKDYIHLLKKETTYFMTSQISYPIYYYEFEYELNNTSLDDFNKKVETKRTYFRYKINSDEELDNLMPKIPLIKEEMYNGISTQPIVVNNVSIDRGSSASLDKHLRLTEIGTMEALENYGNGIWNIHSNTE